MINERLAHGIRETLKEIDIRFHYYIVYPAKEAYESFKQKSWKEKAGITAGTGLAFLVAGEFAKPQAAYTEEAKAEETAEASVPEKSLIDKVKDLELSVKKDPKNADLYLRLGFSYGELGIYDGGLEMYKKAVENGAKAIKWPKFKSGKAEQLETEGTRLMQQKKYDESLKKLEESLELEPNHPLTIYMIGALYQLKGEKNKAIDYSKKALKINPAYCNAYSLVSIVHTDNKSQLEEAIFYDGIYLILNPGYGHRQIILDRIKKNQDFLKEQSNLYIVK